MKKGLFVIISSPGGGGKDTVIAELLKKFPNSTRLVTTTSREPRPGEIPGVTYNFISKDEFEQKIKDGFFLEYNNCVGKLYGTNRTTLENALETHDIVFSNIDVNGKHSMDKAGIEHISIFLLPENVEVLRKRAEKRGGMTEEMIKERLELGEKEIRSSEDYDHRIVNKEGKLAETVAKVAQIIEQKLA